MIYEATIQYETTSDKGNSRIVKESFILNNEELFAVVENTMYENFSSHKDLDVISIKRSKVKEIANSRQSEDDLIWCAEVKDVFMTDEGEKKDTKYKIAFFSKTFDSANAFISNYIRQGYNLSLVSLKETKFKDVIQ